MDIGPGTRNRVSLDGRFFWLGDRKFPIKGVTYGPFAPNPNQEPFPSPAQAAQDFSLIRELGANVVRVYQVPPRWLLDLAEARACKVLVDIPWTKDVCFLDTAQQRGQVRSAVSRAARQCADHPAVLALSVANEIAPDVVRWSGPQAVADFIDELVGAVKEIDAECLCTFGNFPPTEYLRPKEIDFICFNVYLHHRRPFANYLSRLHMLADTKPLVLGEIGIDSGREGADRQADILSWQLETVFRGGAAGAVIFSFCDEWHTGGRDIDDWHFGLTTRERCPKPAFAAVQRQFQRAPYLPGGAEPVVSIVVACYNGARTLKTCLDSLVRLNYPAFEVLLVDDGSTDLTPQIAQDFPQVRLLQHSVNLGLSAARNTGIAAARGTVVAFTDADCRVDPDWLYYLMGDLVRSDFAGIGGPNLLPPDDSLTAAAVMASPGGPAHVMLTDRQAEHIPGCNMAFYKWALEEIGGFDPLFRQAGDDVDLCWRLQQRGYAIGFSPAAFVWHYRRATIGAYLAQQSGYGEAEALLVNKHPEYFSWFGGSMWRGRIYSPAKYGLLFRPPRIYHGPFGSGYFQSLYAGQPELAMMFFTSLEYQVLITLPLSVLAITFNALGPPAISAMLIPVGVCVAAAIQADLPRKKARFWSRPLIALLFFLQPLVRGWARYQGRLSLHPKSLSDHENLDSLTLKARRRACGGIQFWSENGVDRLGFLQAVCRRLEERGWAFRTDIGWSEFDLEITGSLWSRVQLLTVAEHFPEGKCRLSCRLRPAWTFLARVAFGVGLGFELLLITFWGQTPWWHWLVLLTLPALAWWLDCQVRQLQRILVAVLEEMAQHLRLAPLAPPN